MRGIDVSESALADRSPGVLECLLADRATGANIIWATDHYAHLGGAYAPDAEITLASITGSNGFLIRPRVDKTWEHRWDRTKGKAEVFTPSWLCNEQNNRVDEAWFGRPDVFNSPRGRSWASRDGKVAFDLHGPRTWKAYVDERRLEVACGEAPYLVSRYDTTTGEPIDLQRRIGLLDRKLRVVTENAHDSLEWRAWAQRALESVYGFEYQGDSLLLARENLLATYADFSKDALGGEPPAADLLAVATTISWNIWQMDALTGLRPLRTRTVHAGQLDLFGDADDEPGCVIRDWRAKRTHDYGSLIGASQGGT